MSTGGLAERLYSEWYPYLIGVARENCGSEDAEALLHDAFIKFIEHFDCDSDSPPLAWLVLTLKRCCWAAYKRRWRHHHNKVFDENAGALPEHSRAARTRTPEETVEDLESVDEAWRKIGRLKPQERQALVDLGLGFSYKEIEARRGWTHTKINRCIAEGRAALKAAT